MKILPLFMLLVCVVVARAQEEGEARPVGRGIPKRGPLVKGKQTTTTTTAAPQEEDAEYDEEAEYAEEGQEGSTEAPTSTTEGRKLVGSGVRPFRSNTDLIEILKRKRAQAAEAKLNGPTTTTTSAPAQDSLDPTKINYNTKTKKRFNNSPVTREVASDDAPAPPKTNRGRFGRPSTRTVQETEEEVVETAPPARPTRTFRRGSN